MNHIRRKWHAVSIAAVLLLSLALSVWYAATIRSEDVRFDNEPVYTLDGAWRVEINGTPAGTVTLPAHIDVQAGDVLVLRTFLQKMPTACNSVMFHSSHQYVDVYANGSHLLSYGRDQTTPVSMSPGSPWQYTRLPGTWENRELTIRLVGFYDEYAGNMGQVYLGTKASLLYMVVKQAAPLLLLIVPVLIAGVVMLIASFYFRQPSAVRKIRYLGAFTVAACVWMLMEMQITQLLTGQILLFMNILFLLFSLLPVLIQSYLLSYEIFNHSKYMHGVFALCVAFFFFINLARVFGAADYLYTVPLVHLACLLIIGGVLVVLVREKVNHRSLQEEVRFLFAAVLVLSFFALLDMVRFYIPFSPMKTIQFTQIGLCCFVVILGYSAIKQESMAQTERIQQQMLTKLAYTDILTDLGNRTAFEKQLEVYRREEAPRRLILMMADMDDLKAINDQKGHSAGDQAIVCMAWRLQDHFGDQGLCYRIGGDEFCVISETLSYADFAARVDAYTGEMSTQRVEGYPVNVSCGFTERGTQSVDEALSLADARMYEAKARQKAANAARESPGPLSST